MGHMFYNTIKSETFPAIVHVFIGEMEEVMDSKKWKSLTQHNDKYAPEETKFFSKIGGLTVKCLDILGTETNQFILWFHPECIKPSFIAHEILHLTYAVMSNCNVGDEEAWCYFNAYTTEKMYESVNDSEYEIVMPSKKKKRQSVFDMIESAFLNSLIGTSKEVCMKMCKLNSYNFRIVREDETHFSCSLDFQSKRINIEIDNGIVTGCFKG